jgi:hypothetical protein
MVPPPPPPVAAAAVVTTIMAVSTKGNPVRNRNDESTDVVFGLLYVM